MAAPIDRLIETLTEVRSRLEDELGRVEAYRALRQLQQREASGERLSIVSADQLRQKLEAELAGNNYLDARIKLDEALELLGVWGAGKSAPTRIDRQADDARTATPKTQANPAPDQAVAADLSMSTGNESRLPPDDLTLIRDLPKASIGVISAAGFGHYKALAEIDSQSVAMLERLLGQPGIVAQGNWIEQAAILASGRETRHAARVIARRTGVAWPPAHSGPGVVAVATVSSNDPRLGLPHDLTHIRGIDAELAQRLTEAGISSFADIAAWTAADLQRVSGEIAIAPSRIAAECWIEQAALLAAGHLTRFLDTKLSRPVLVPVPPDIAIPLDDDVLSAAELHDVGSAASEPMGTDEIHVDLPGNDDAVPQSSEIPGESPFWAAAAGKAEVLKPLRKTADRAGSAFDDVAALVARTVATARNVGGMKEPRNYPQPTSLPPATVPITAEAPVPPVSQGMAQTSQTATMTKAPALAEKPSPVMPRAAAAAVAGPRPSDRPKPATARTVDAGGTDAEASIEIRPRVTGRPTERVLPRALSLDEGSTARVFADVQKTLSARKAPPDQPATPTFVVPRAPGTPRVPSSVQRPSAATHPNGRRRQTIVIDELSTRHSAPGGASAGSATMTPEMPAPRLGRLVDRFVRAFRGDRTS
jgi:predicted flap endonuclease-1-like 5' DNA nuclease